MSVWNKRLKILDGSKARVENDFGGFIDSIPVGMERQIDDVKFIVSAGIIPFIRTCYVVCIEYKERILPVV